MESDRSDPFGAMSDEELAGDLEEDLDGMDPYEAESELTLSDDDLSYRAEDEDQEKKTPSGGSIGRQEQVQMIHMRRFLDQLTENVVEKDFIVTKTREELKKCQERIEQLEAEREDTLREIQEAEQQDKISAVYRLRAQFERICDEMNNEEELAAKIKAALDEAEYELSQAQVEQGKFLLAEDELQKKEEMWRNDRTQQARLRGAKESGLARQAETRKKQRDRDLAASLKAKEDQQKMLLEEATKSKDKHSKFLKQTMEKLRRRESQESEREKSHLEQRMKTMLALKSDITANRENLTALQARDKAYAHKAKEEEERKRSEILDDGGNPNEQLIKEKRLQQFEEEKKQFKASQRERQVEIARRILAEEEHMKKRKQQQPLLWDDPKREKSKIVKPQKKLKLQAFEQYKAMMAGEPQEAPPVIRREDGTFIRGEDDSEEEGPRPATQDYSHYHVSESESDEETVEPGNLAKPEFEGLWDAHKPYKVPKEMDSNIKLPGASKMDKEIMQKVLDKHREGIVIKQVAGGKEFKGRPFYSKPEIIHFKDFDVGKAYKKKVVLTNASYSVNYCKLTGLTEHLKDFIDLHFDPPGQMSAGLTCEMLVTFKPMINEDLVGEVSFLAQTGPFSIPIQCTTKKCDLKVDHDTVDFSTTVIGETLKRSITLINEGALATQFEFYKVTGLNRKAITTADTSLGRLTTADTMRAVSPDSTDAAEKAKVTNERVAALKKKQEAPPAEKPPVIEGAGGEEGEDHEKDEGVVLDDQPEYYDDGSSVGSGEMLDHDLASLDGMKVGPVSSGEIGPHSTVRLEIIWQPTIPGRVDTEFAITFTDPLSQGINCTALANAVDVPVWVERQNVDLKICMYDRLYQDTILVNNRATTALRLKFEVCKELRNHLELLPKTGYIQAQSTFSAQLKFLPRASLAEEAGKYYDKETGVLQAPMVITVADQTRPVPFTVHAVVTSSDLEFDVTSLDFGCCTIYESVKATVKLTNKSILAQKFGFVGIPEYVDVQPNDGFGTLLPQETIELDIMFNPKKARNYSFELTCKSLINREFKIQCKGVGVHPPLELTQQVVHFAATALNDVSTAALHVVNNHLDTNEFTHPVPRIGKGDIAPVGPTSFEFVVPKDSPITVSPSVGTVMPGKKQRITVRFTPRLRDADIRAEAVRMVTRAMELRAQQEYEAALAKEKEAQQQDNNPAKGAKKPPPPKKPSPKGPRKGGEPQSVAAKGPAAIQPPDENKITKGTDEYAAAQASLLRQFKGDFNTFKIPCYIASGKCRNPGELPYSIHNTLYLEVHCPEVRPELVVISDSGRTTLDFGNISIGQSINKPVTIQNISDKTVDLRGSVLDTSGPFQMLNSLRDLPPDASHTILMCFTPEKGQVFQEVLEILTPSSTLYITLAGCGVSPVVNLSVQNGVMDMGTVIAGEYREEVFKIENTSKLSIHYSIRLDSQSLLHYKKSQSLPEYIDQNQNGDKKNLVGTQNYNGQTVFDCVPAEGVIHPGAFQEVMVTFSPDHPSFHFSEGVRVELFGQEEAHVFRLIGEAHAHVMYIDGGDALLPSVESLAVTPQVEEDEELKSQPKPLLVTLHSIANNNGEFSTASHDIQIGCVRTMAVSQKKNGEWLFDSLTTISPLGFNIDPLKGMLEAGTKRPVTITWTPPPGYDPNKAMEASINVTVTGDVKEQYKIMLRALVVSE